MKLRSSRLIAVPYPKGRYTEEGSKTHQVFDIDISRVVIEYQAQRLINEQGKCFVAPFPKKVSKAVQYGDGIKAHAVYLSQYQLLPYKRIQEYFADRLQMPISEVQVVSYPMKRAKNGRINIEHCWRKQNGGE